MTTTLEPRHMRDYCHGGHVIGWEWSTDERAGAGIVILCDGEQIDVIRGHRTVQREIAAANAYCAAHAESAPADDPRYRAGLRQAL